MNNVLLYLSLNIALLIANVCLSVVTVWYYIDIRDKLDSFKKGIINRKRV